MAKLGELAYSHFSLYEADGQTKRSGAAGDVTTTLLRAGAVAAEVVTIEEIAATDEYAATFTPLALGTYTIVIRDTVRGLDAVESFLVTENDIDDVAAAVANVAASATPAVVSVLNVDALRVGEAWTPIIVVLRRSTMVPADPDGAVLDLVEVLAGDGSEVIEEIDGADVDRVGVGRFEANPAALASAGTVYLRVTLTFAGLEVVDVVRLAVAPALGDATAIAGGTTVLARVNTYPTSLTRARFDLTGRTDADVWRLIRDATAHVEALALGNRFNAEYGEYLCNGKGSRVVYHPEQVPFCWLEQVELNGGRTDHRRDRMFIQTMHSSGTSVIDVDRYALRAGMVEAIRTGFPAGVGNVIVTGAVGVVANGRYIATISTTEVGSASTSVDVEDATGYAARDVLEIVGEFASIRTILVAVDLELNRLHFDAQGGDFAPIEMGAAVRTFGQVPLAVEQVTNYLVGLQLREEAANAEGQEFLHPMRVLSERTDDYEIRFQGLTARQTLTGNPKYDQLLAPYIKDMTVRTT